MPVSYKVSANLYLVQSEVSKSGPPPKQVVDPYVNQIQAKKAVEKFKKKAKEKVRRYLRLPTIWDRLSRED